MAKDLIGGAVIGAVFSELQTAVLDVLKTTANFKSIFQRLQTTIISITPIFEDVEKFGALLNRPQNERDMFVDQMVEGKELIFKSSKVKRWNMYKKYVYSKKLTEFDEKLMKFFQISMQAVQSMYIRKLDKFLNEIVKEVQELGVLVSMINPPPSSLNPHLGGIMPSVLNLPPGMGRMESYFNAIMPNLALQQRKEGNDIKEPENEDATTSQIKQSAIEESVRTAISVGPWGGEGGRNLYNYIGKGDISHIYIRHEVDNIKAIWFTSQDKNGRFETSSLIGGENGYYHTSEVVLDTKIREKLVGISGTVGKSWDFTVVTSLKFYTSTNRSFGPFGLENGARFSYMADEGCSIVGFYGRFGGLLDSIGLHMLVT